MSLNNNENHLHVDLIPHAIVRIVSLIFVVLQDVNKMRRNRLPRIMKYCSPTGRRNHDGHLKRLLGT